MEIVSWGVGPPPGDDVVEARDAELLDEDALRVEHLGDGDEAVCHEDVDFVQDGHARHHLQQHRRHRVDVLAVVQTHTCAHTHLISGDIPEVARCMPACAATYTASAGCCGSSNLP